jgi:hypothetical protein
MVNGLFAELSLMFIQAYVKYRQYKKEKKAITVAVASTWVFPPVTDKKKQLNIPKNTASGRSVKVPACQIFYPQLI